MSNNQITLKQLSDISSINKEATSLIQDIDFLKASVQYAYELKSKQQDMPEDDIKIVKSRYNNVQLKLNEILGISE